MNGERNWTVDLSEAALAAEAAGPCARAVRYDAGRNLIEFSLTSGAFFAVPRDLIQGLRGATAEQLEDVWLDRAGLSVHWPSLDADFSILGLVQGIFGTKAWMAEISDQGLKQIEWYKEHVHTQSAPKPL
ncbi:MAG: DUF2442 domain-containing protein [Cyanobacteriota bacterium]|nr:DUF2442 domain-containing protein [Cyanobacteriota bacterium]